MLNSYANSGGNKLSQSQNQSLNINAVSGSILKNHPKSWFMMIDLNSRYANAVLAEGGHKAQKKSTYHSEIPSIVVLKGRNVNTHSVSPRLQTGRDMRACSLQ